MAVPHLKTEYKERLKPYLATYVKKAEEVMQISEMLEISEYTNEAIELVREDVAGYVVSQCHEYKYHLEPVQFYTVTSLFFRELTQLSNPVIVGSRSDQVQSNPVASHTEIQLEKAPAINGCNDQQQGDLTGNNGEVDVEEPAVGMGRNVQQPARIPRVFNAVSYGSSTGFVRKYRWVGQDEKGIRVRINWSKEELQIIFPSLSYSAAMARVKGLKSQEQVVLIRFPGRSWEKSHDAFEADRTMQKTTLTGKFGNRKARRHHLQPDGRNDQNGGF